MECLRIGLRPRHPNPPGKQRLRTTDELTSYHTIRMVNHMKTTLNISDVTMNQLRREAARQGRTMSELVEAALRALLQPQDTKTELPPLPAFRTGGARINVANRDALYEKMEG